MYALYCSLFYIYLKYVLSSSLHCMISLSHILIKLIQFRFISVTLPVNFQFSKLWDSLGYRLLNLIRGIILIMFIYVWKAIVNMDEYYHGHRMLDGEMGMSSNWPSSIFISCLDVIYPVALSFFLFCSLLDHDILYLQFWPKANLQKLNKYKKSFLLEVAFAKDFIVVTEESKTMSVMFYYFIIGEE